MAAIGSGYSPVNRPDSSPPPAGAGGDPSHAIADRALGPRTPDNSTPHYVDDGSLDTNNQNCSDLSAQPLVAAGGHWDGAHILNAQSQLETAEPASANNQESRCGPSAVLGAAIMAGPNATARVAENLSTSPWVTDDRQKQDLQGIRDRIQGGSATHGDLSHLQQYMYQAYGHSDGSGTDADGITMMQQDLADKTTIPGEQSTSGPQATTSDGQGLNHETPAATQQRIAQLQNGQSFILNVKMDPNDANVHHFVTVGRDNGGQNYVYDPYPRDNQPNVVYAHQNQNGFNHYVDGSSGTSATNNGQPTRVNTWEGGTMTFNR